MIRMLIMLIERKNFVLFRDNYVDIDVMEGKLTAGINQVGIDKLATNNKREGNRWQHFPLTFYALRLFHCIFLRTAGIKIQ